MKNNNFFSKLLSTFLEILLLLGFLWFEFAGIYHSFAHLGVKDGVIAIMVPPYSWYRSIDFIFWLKKGEKGRLSKSERKEIQHFINSLNLKNKATKLMNENIKKEKILTGSLDKEIFNDITNLLKGSLKESQNVRDEILLKLHPDLPKHYREEFCEGIRLYLQGTDKLDYKMQLQGQILVEEWWNWYENNIYKKYKTKQWF